MTGPEHYVLAEEILASAYADTASAQVHATLALAAGMVLSQCCVNRKDSEAWYMATHNIEAEVGRS